ncbi:MAG: NADPH:quinone oxidoreductase family protein [Kordiimonadaceae bacterium]|nr:NADPH:quinone oxidoreductase family protein [Kordiimonadaceae bacterium]MBO6570020.1 NADPH:quinone oxidoreductase family protein [Kordiimonadaceae bacterium]MBO6965883.1 NADPH:quinone oxidoreductase family protein [Kordiimonadaceae bacterium]
MKAVLCKELGPADKLVVEETADPEVAPGHVLVDVKAAGLNFPDTLIIEGKYQFKPDLPFTPGGEGAGVISAVGEGVSHLNVGDKIIFMCQTGAFAEKVVVPAITAIPMPDGLSFEMAAGITLTYGTSYHALKQRAQLKEGETVLVLGAAGGVGIATVELAKAMGAKVIAAASTDEKLEFCKASGADELINYSTEDMKTRLKEITGGKGVDVIYDPVGGDYTETAFRNMAPNGRHLVIGFAAGDIPKVPINLCLLKQASLVGVFWGAWAGKNPSDQIQNMKEILGMVASGQVRASVNDVFPLDDVEAAYACLTERRAKGKVILTT